MIDITDEITEAIHPAALDYLTGKDFRAAIVRAIQDKITTARMTKEE